MPRSRLQEAVLPARLGRDFHKLVLSIWSQNFGDGLMLAAGPLLIASQTHSPALVAAAIWLQQIPWLVFGLYAGALADRYDRQRIVIVANLARIAVLAVLLAAIVTDHVSIMGVLVAFTVHSICEVFVDSTQSTLTPMLVAKADLGVANARKMAGMLTFNQLVGPALGAALFAVGAAVPFATQIVLVLAGVAILTRIQVPAMEPRTEATHLRRDIAEGVRWLLGHHAVRTLALVIFIFNITWAAAWAMLVLYSLKVLDAGPVGFGLLTTASAIGGMIGTASYDWLEKRVALSTIMKVCLSLEVVMHAALALTRELWIALLIMFVFGAYAFIWGTVSNTVRMRAVPTAFQGRVGSVYTVGVTGGMAIGGILAGFIAEQWGILAPFWFAFVGSGITLLLVWRSLGMIAHADGEELEAAS